MFLKEYLDSNRIFVSHIFVGTVLLLLLFTGSHWEDIGVIDTVLFLIGAIFVGIATIGRLWSSMYIAGYKNNSLITEGPYSLCRNPLYFFSCIGAIGVGLATETIAIPIIIALGFAFMYPFVIKEEEHRLQKLHPTEYENYRSNTPTFFPSLSHFSEPEEYQVKPKIFRKCLMDAMWFVWLLGIMELIEGLHEHFILQVLFRLY